MNNTSMYALDTVYTTTLLNHVFETLHVDVRHVKHASKILGKVRMAHGCSREEETCLFCGDDGDSGDCRVLNLAAPNLAVDQAESLRGMIQASQVIFKAATEDVVEGDQVQNGVEEGAVFPRIEKRVAAADVELEKLFDVTLLVCDEDGQCQQIYDRSDDTPSRDKMTNDGGESETRDDKYRKSQPELTYSTRRASRPRASCSR